VKLVVNEQRLGWRRNFLKSASLCTSEYIAFCDQDDIWLPDKLATVQLYLEKNDLCFSSTDIVRSTVWEPLFRSP
jgi:glycosyltransferase involved in cell wall biosynthesis